MKILPLNNYQTRNQNYGKQDINFCSSKVELQEIIETTGINILELPGVATLKNEAALLFKEAEIKDYNAIFNHIDFSGNDPTDWVSDWFLNPQEQKRFRKLDPTNIPAVKKQIDKIKGTKNIFRHGEYPDIRKSVHEIEKDKYNKIFELFPILQAEIKDDILKYPQFLRDMIANALHNADEVPPKLQDAHGHLDLIDKRIANAFYNANNAVKSAVSKMFEELNNELVELINKTYS